MKSLSKDESGMAYEFVYVAALIIFSGLAVYAVWIIRNYITGFYNADIDAGLVSSRTSYFMGYQDGLIWLLPFFVFIVIFAWTVIRAVELHGEQNS